MFEFILALLSPLALRTVSQFQVRAEMALGGALGGAAIMYYYIRKWRSGTFGGKDGKNMASTLIAVFMFVIMALVV